MQKLLIYILLFFGGLGLGYYLRGIIDKDLKNKPTEESYRKSEGNQTLKSQDIAKKEADDYENSLGRNSTNDVPNKVFQVLNHISSTHEPIEGYVGGRKFRNLEGELPKKTKNGEKITYQEWDVNPKMEGKNRGAERLVTGDDGSAYYTRDHYKSFKKIQ